MSNGVIPINLLHGSAPIVHCCDAGFDIDDFGALLLAFDSGRLQAILTSLYRPDQKKSVIQAFLKTYTKDQLLPESLTARINNLLSHIYAGNGYYPNEQVASEVNRANFLSLYPRWPTSIFGDPAIADSDPNYKCIYPYQMKPFLDNGILLASQSSQSELDLFDQFLNTINEPIVFVSTGPTTNLAALLRKDPERIKSKIKTIVLMNGTFLNPPRMGYNGGLNLRDTKTVFESGIPCLIVTSALCANFTFPKEIMEKMTANRDNMTAFGKLFHDIMLSWEVHRARKKNPNVDPAKLTLEGPILADPLTMLLALHPELIKEVRQVRYTFDLNSDKHLLDPNASELVKVEEDATSTVYEVVSLLDPQQVRELLVNKLSIGLLANKL